MLRVTHVQNAVLFTPRLKHTFAVKKGGRKTTVYARQQAHFGQSTDCAFKLCSCLHHANSPF